MACGEATDPDLCRLGRDCGLWLRAFKPPLGAIIQAEIPTYDGSGQTVHPDVVVVPSWLGRERLDHWLGITPYPGGHAQFENPSIFASMNPRYWGVPRGP
jgi:hypothetical protein